MMRDNEYTAIDFVGMYADRVRDEEEFDKVDDMLRAAAVLTVAADDILEDALPKRVPDPFPMHEGGRR